MVQKIGSSQGDKGKVDRVYLDNAASSQRSREFVESYCEYLEKDKSAEDEFRYFCDLVVKISEYLEVDPKTISLVPNATYGLNETAYFLREKLPESRVFLSDSEHASNHLIWLRLYSKNVSFFPLSSPIKCNSPAIYSFSLMSNLEGTIFDLKRLEDIKKNARDIIVADSSQYLSHHTLSLRNSPIDFLIFTAHKFWGPNGLGVVYSKDCSNIGLNMDNYHEKKKLGYDLDTAGIYAWLKVWGTYASMYKAGIIQRKEGELIKYFLSNFPSSPHFSLLDSGGQPSPIFLIQINSPEFTSQDFSFYLQTKEVQIRAGLSCSLLSENKFDPLKIFRVWL